MKPEYLAFLKKLNTDEVPHERGTLFEHLTGTYNYLASWGSEEHVCAAGLFHSIYGTTIFHHQSVSHTDREQIRNLIGKKAEDLVYTFSTIDRPLTLITAIRDRHATDMASKTKKPISREKLAELIEIEIANLLEQGSEQWFLKELIAGVSDGSLLLRKPILFVIYNRIHPSIAAG